MNLLKAIILGITLLKVINLKMNLLKTRKFRTSIVKAKWVIALFDRHILLAEYLNQLAVYY